MESPKPSQTELDLMKLEVMKARLEVAKESMDDSFASTAWVLRHIMGFSNGEAEWLAKK